MKTLFFLCILSISLFSKVDINLSHTNIIHGTTFAVILQSDKRLTQAPNVIYKNKTFQMFTINGSIKKYRVFIPVDYYSKKQEENVQVRYKSNDNLNKKNFAVNIIDVSTSLLNSNLTPFFAILAFSMNAKILLCKSVMEISSLFIAQIVSRN